MKKALETKLIQVEETLGTRRTKKHRFMFFFIVTLWNLLPILVNPSALRVWMGL